MAYRLPPGGGRFEERMFAAAKQMGGANVNNRPRSMTSQVRPKIPFATGVSNAGQQIPSTRLTPHGARPGSLRENVASRERR